MTFLTDDEGARKNVLIGFVVVRKSGVGNSRWVSKLCTRNASRVVQS